MATQRIITKGEDFALIAHLKTPTGAAYAGAVSGTVTAHFVDKKTAGTINGNTVAQADSGGANWAAGAIEVVMSDTDTAALTVGSYLMQINVTESGGAIRKVLLDENFLIRSAS